MTTYSETPLTESERILSKVFSEILYPGMSFLINYEPLYLQVRCSAADNRTGGPFSWKGRKWLLSPYMTDGELVQTAFLAVVTALEHEAREKFTYKGVSIFDPHYDIERLVGLRMTPGAIKEREPV